MSHMDISTYERRDSGSSDEDRLSVLRAELDALRAALDSHIQVCPGAEL